MANSKLRDGKHWVKTLPITQNLWKELIQATHASAVRSLDASEKLLSIGGDEAMCAGLYTYAVEELGKLILLDQYIPSNQQVVIHFKKIFREHYDKFRAATEYLRKNAPACLVLKHPIFDTSIFDPKIFDTTETIIKDFETRTAIFYCDIADSGDSVRSIPDVDKELLREAIKELRKVLNVWLIRIQKKYMST
jgi:AbiV family abortive infection protein